MYFLAIYIWPKKSLLQVFIYTDGINGFAPRIYFWFIDFLFSLWLEFGIIFLEVFLPRKH